MASERNRVVMPHKIVVVLPHGIGNMILALPALKALAEEFRGVRIDCVSLLPSVTAMLREMEAFNGIFTKVHEVGMPASQRGAIASLRALSALRAERYDLSILLFPTLSFHYNLLSRLIGAKRRLGFRYPDDKVSNLAWLNTEVVEVGETLHDAEQNLRIVRLGVGREDAAPPAPFPDAPPPPGARVIGFHTGCKKEYAYKQWGRENFAQVAEAALEADETVRLRFFFGPDEEGDLPWFRERLGEERVEYARGASIGETFRLINECLAFVCNDSGLMHLAAFGGAARVLAIIGPSDERRTGPFGEKSEIVVRDLPCRPCCHTNRLSSRKFACTSEKPLECLAGIPPEKVISRLKAFLAENA